MSLIKVGFAESSGYNINNSLRFRSSASAYLNRTFATPTSSTIWTWSAWVKRGALTGTYRLFGASTTTYLTFNSSDQLNLTLNGTSAATTTAVYRDPAAWYHIVYTQNGSAQTIYVNGTSVATGTTAASIFNTAIAHQIGSANTSNYLDGYLTEVNFIDGQALTPSSFGSTNPSTGAWQPAKYTGTYGINGFYLPFTDTSGTSQNFILSSEDFSNGTYWDKTTYPVTVTANSVTAPNGTTTADTLLGANGVLSLIFQSVATSITGTGALTASIYAKVGTGTEFTLNAYYSSDTEVNTTFNVSTGTVISGSGTITSVGSGWYRCSIQIPARTGAGTSVVFRIWTNPRGDATNRSIYAWGAQINTGATVCPYYPTTTAAQTSINNLGRDYSVTTGGYNNWIPNNISVTAGATYDAMTDSPTLTSTTVGNYCVLNNIALVGTSAFNGSTSNANLTATTATNTGSGVGATMAVNMPSDNKWYWEVTLVSGVTGAVAACQLGVTENSAPDGLGGASYVYNSSDSPTYTNGDTISFAYDGTASTLYFYKNNVLAKTVTSASSNAALIPFIRDNLGGGFIVADFNFGQRPFLYTPPAGYNRLNTFNLSASSIIKGNTVIDASIYTGTGSSRSVTNSAGFKPDFVWVKSRSGATDHALYDSVRGTTKQLESNTTTAETTEATGLTAFNTNGFTVGALAQMNTNAATYIAWQWQAGQGSSSSNTSGSITSTVSVNANAGFSVATFTTPASGGPWTIGHGLGVAPSLIIAKSSSAALNWVVYHIGTGNTAYTLLNTTALSGGDSGAWNNTSPTSTVFTNGTTAFWGASATYVAYCWAEIAGFSRAFSYTGNGSADGTFVYTGFLPRFVLIKRTDTTGDWYMWDTARNTYDVITNTILSNSAAAETSATSIDALSNGFKLRNTTAGFNASGGNYIGMAWATNPFKNSNAF
jgi:hypothetical protein